MDGKVAEIRLITVVLTIKWMHSEMEKVWKETAKICLIAVF